MRGCFYLREHVSNILEVLPAKLKLAHKWSCRRCSVRRMPRGRVDIRHGEEVCFHHDRCCIQHFLQWLARSSSELMSKEKGQALSRAVAHGWAWAQALARGLTLVQAFARALTQGLALTQALDRARVALVRAWARAWALFQALAQA